MLCTNFHNSLQHPNRTFTLSIVYPLMGIHITAMLKFPTPISCDCIHESIELHVSVLKHTILNTKCKPPYIIKWVKSHPLPMSAWQHPFHCTCHEQYQQPEHASLAPSWRCKEIFLWLCLCKMKLLKGYQSCFWLQNVSWVIHKKFWHLLWSQSWKCFFKLLFYSPKIMSWCHYY